MLFGRHDSGTRHKIELAEQKLTAFGLLKG